MLWWVLPNHFLNTTRLSPHAQQKLGYPSWKNEFSAWIGAEYREIVSSMTECVRYIHCTPCGCLLWRCWGFLERFHLILKVISGVESWKKQTDQQTKWKPINQPEFPRKNIVSLKSNNTFIRECFSYFSETDNFFLDFLCLTSLHGLTWTQQPKTFVFHVQYMATHSAFYCLVVIKWSWQKLLANRKHGLWPETLHVTQLPFICCLTGLDSSRNVTIINIDIFIENNIDGLPCDYWYLCLLLKICCLETVNTQYLHETERGTPQSH